MLRIEKLFLQGFKSFCDPTEVIFDQEGITAVVGPNGCGKSNVADGINWVIGQQSAKSLRGAKMEDVIFQGSRSRNPAGMAEVLLTMRVMETFEIRGQAQPEAEALKQAEDSLNQAAVAVDAVSDALAPPQTEVEPELNPDAPPAVEGEPSQELEPAQAAEAVSQGRAFKKQRLFKKPPSAVQQVFEAGERITVGRRLFRTGESEYEMNGRSCRLRDVQELFAGTGLGGAHYAIIEQGRIGQVLSAKPADRRSLIEEAAGISKFKMRQHSAELKLEASKGNLSRVTDIINEIERQQNSLKRQAQRARRYKRLRQEMRDLMRAVYVVDYRVSSARHTELGVALTEISARETEVSESIVEFEVAHNDSVQKSRHIEELLNSVREEAAGADLETERSRQQQTYLTEQLQSLGARAEQVARDQAAISERNQIISQETVRLRESLERLEVEINLENKTLTEEEDRHRDQMRFDADAERRLEEARKRVVERVTTLERWRQLQRQFTDSVDRSRTRLEGLARERERAASQAEAAEHQFAKLCEEREIITLRQQQTSERLADTVDELQTARRLRETNQTRLTALQRDFTTTEQRMKSLGQIDQRKSYFSEAVQSLMKHASQGANGFKTLGALADYVRVAPEHESMVETALRDELQYVVVPTLDDALHAIDYLKTEGAGRATFLVLDPSQRAHETNGHHSYPDGNNRYQTLDNILDLQPEFARAFSLAMPGLANARVVEDAREAAQFSSNGNGSGPLISLTKSGERVIAGRIVTGGSASEKGIGVLALKREISELSARYDELTIEVRATETALGEARERIAELEEVRARLDSELRQMEKQIAVQREQLQQCQREIERAVTHIRIVGQETEQAETERLDFEGKLEHATRQTAEAEEARAEADAVVAGAQDEIAELRSRAEIRIQELSRRRADFAARTERRKGLQNDLRRLESEANDLEGRLSRNRLESVEADDQTGVTRTTLSGLAEQLQRQIADQRRLAFELEMRSRALGEARDRVDLVNQQLRAARDTVSATREERSQREIERAKLSSDLEHLINSCHAELGENIVEVCQRLETNQAPEDEIAVQPMIREQLLEDDAEEESLEEEQPISFWNVPEDFDLESAKTRLDDLRSKIDAIGPVNMMALDELVEVEERFIFLTGQKADIESAIFDTQAAIAEIKRRSKERFVDAFHAINENFKVMFQELFGGGQGEMKLIDETDVLESGIELIAQPPGKRLQNVLLLSGGEKAMSAMALVLAIFKYRPSPFCLLDEVDAPLDEVNIGRFADKVVEMSGQTQFMIITHSKRTMEAANTLYGVTMEDPGVSKLISVKLAARA
jgi:chromosome segregation protein